MCVEEIVKRKLEERNSKFIKEWLVPEDKLPDDIDVLEFPTKSGFLSAKEIEITESSAGSILEKVKSKEWTAYEVASAFGHRATIAHQLTNCLSEVFFEEGLETAKLLDEYYERTGKLKGPLHGLPVSLKDNINVKGKATSVGFVGWALEPESFDFDSVSAEILREKGAVFYVKTNVPVAMMMPETVNHVFGYTSNPLNRNQTAGGSSGGEAVLLALKGSPVGIGSDIGGSIRLPTSLNNLFGIRPSFGRLPTYGTRSGLPGFESVNSVCGPMSTTIEGLTVFTKAILDGEPWLKDPKVLNLPWADVELPKKLNFAILKDDGVVKPYPAIIRALDLVQEKLKAEGHEIIEWEPLHHQELGDLVTKFFLSDGGQHVKQACALTGEKLYSYMQMYETAPDIHVSELWDLQARRTKLMKEYLDHWSASAEKFSNGKPIDAIILPATPYSGCGKNKFRYVGYTSVFNALDYTGGIIPVLRADKDIDVLDDRYKSPRSELERVHFEEYDLEEIHGGAAAVQIVGGRLKEEKVFKMMEMISKAVGSFDYWKK